MKAINSARASCLFIQKGFPSISAAINIATEDSSQFLENQNSITRRKWKISSSSLFFLCMQTSIYIYIHFAEVQYTCIEEPCWSGILYPLERFCANMYILYSQLYFSGSIDIRYTNTCLAVFVGVTKILITTIFSWICRHFYHTLSVKGNRHVMVIRKRAKLLKIQRTWTSCTQGVILLTL